MAFTDPHRMALERRFRRWPRYAQRRPEKFACLTSPAAEAPVTSVVEPVEILPDIGKCFVYLNNRNRLTSLRGMIDYLRKVPGAVPVIVDNASTYPPLLDFYAATDVEIVRLADNVGPRAPWWCVPGGLDRGRPYYVVSDSDLDLSGIPTDVLSVLAGGLQRYPWAIKAGLSLEVNDVLVKLDVGTHPGSKWWYFGDRVDSQFWRADVDTTFAAYRAGSDWGGYGPALRSDRPYACRHLPWYVTPENVTEEDQYYFDHAERGMSTAWMALT